MGNFKVEIKLDRIHCYDENDGPGNAEPYLWTAFFKVDGETVVLKTDGDGPIKLVGIPTVVTTPGNHGNLGTTDVDEDDNISIPAIIGKWTTTMRPIPFTRPLLGKTETDGLIGVCLILMEEDFTPNDAIAHGHNALNSGIRDGLAKILSQISLSHTEISNRDISNVTSTVTDSVKNAISSNVNIWEWIAGWGNQDDQIGSEVFRWSQTDLVHSSGAPIPFSHRWKHEGDWEIFGHVTATEIK